MNFESRKYYAPTETGGNVSESQEKEAWAASLNIVEKKLQAHKERFPVYNEAFKDLEVMTKLFLAKLGFCAAGRDIEQYQDHIPFPEVLNEEGRILEKPTDQLLRELATLIFEINHKVLSISAVYDKPTPSSESEFTVDTLEHYYPSPKQKEQGIEPLNHEVNDVFVGPGSAGRNISSYFNTLRSLPENTLPLLIIKNSLTYYGDRVEEVNQYMNACIGRSQPISGKEIAPLREWNNQSIECQSDVVWWAKFIHALEQRNTLKKIRSLKSENTNGEKILQEMTEVALLTAEFIKNLEMEPSLREMFLSSNLKMFLNGTKKELAGKMNGFTPFSLENSNPYSNSVYKFKEAMGLSELNFYPDNYDFGREGTRSFL